MVYEKIPSLVRKIIALPAVEIMLILRENNLLLNITKPFQNSRKIKLSTKIVPGKIYY